MSFAAMLTNTGLTIMADGKTHQVSSSHPQYEKIILAYKNDDHAEVLRLIDLENVVQTFGDGKLTVEKGVVKYRDRILSRAITKRILRMIDEGFNVAPMVAFLDNLMENPSFRAVEELYGFLETNELPITPDGHFMAYRRVTFDFKDFHTRTYDNSVGQTLTMERNMVDEDKNRTCSNGFHVCSLPYLKDFHAGEGHIVTVKVNPRDVVSVPTDYNFTKMRVCSYTVTGIHSSEDEEAWNKIVAEQEEAKKSPEQKQADLIANAVKAALTDMGLANSGITNTVTQSVTDAVGN